MTYQAFSNLWRDAAEASDFDRYVAERGWQSWMDAYADQGDSAVLTALTRVWEMARGGVRAIRAQLGISQVAFAAAFRVPRRSVENWESGASSPPTYLPMLLGYAVFSILEERSS